MPAGRGSAARYGSPADDYQQVVLRHDRSSVEVTGLETGERVVVALMDAMLLMPVSCARRDTWARCVAEISSACTHACSRPHTCCDSAYAAAD